MRIWLDTDRCQGHARCVAEAPDLFDSDDLGHAVILVEGELDDHQADRARRAAAQCPERAIATD